MLPLNKVADTENRLLNPDIDDIFKIQEDIAVARRMAYGLKQLEFLEQYI